MDVVFKEITDGLEVGIDWNNKVVYLCFTLSTPANISGVDISIDFEDIAKLIDYLSKELIK